LQVELAEEFILKGTINKRRPVSTGWPFLNFVFEQEGNREE